MTARMIGTLEVHGTASKILGTGKRPTQKKNFATSIVLDRIMSPISL